MFEGSSVSIYNGASFEVRHGVSSARRRELQSLRGEREHEERKARTSGSSPADSAPR